jgi:hypothetical protein
MKNVKGILSLLVTTGALAFNSTSNLEILNDQEGNNVLKTVIEVSDFSAPAAEGANNLYDRIMPGTNGANTDISPGPRPPVFTPNGGGITAVDQFLIPNPQNTIAEVDEIIDHAQTFTVGVNGQLTGVDLLICRGVAATQDLLVDVRRTIMGVPVENDTDPNLIIASAVVPSTSVPVGKFEWVHVELSGLGKRLLTGEVLALVLRPSQPFLVGRDDGYGWGGNLTGNQYLNGSRYSRAMSLGVPWERFPQRDMGFRIYMHIPAVSVVENTTEVTTVTAMDADTDPITFSISGGADAAKFSINSATGILTFIEAPDFEMPTDAGANNVYDVTVRASDGSLFNDQDIAVTVTNTPIANSWLDRFYSPSSVLLSAWGSYDPDGGSVTFSWKKIAGPDHFTMLYGESANPVVSNLVNGTYTFQLTVTNEEGETGSSDVSFTVTGNPNHPPIAEAWFQKYYSSTSALLAAWGSQDPEGGLITYFWEKLAGPEGSELLYSNSASPVVTGLVEGTYRFRLTVTDMEGAEATNDLSFTVTKNLPPIAGAWLQKFDSPTSALLAAWDSHDPDGGPITYIWQKIAGPDGSTLLYWNSASPVVEGLVIGTYTYRLTVTDDKGATATKDLSFTVGQTDLSATQLHTLDGLRFNEERSSFNLTAERFSLYPNPTKELLKMTWDSEYRGVVQIKLVDIAGRILKQNQVRKEQLNYSAHVDVRQLRPGIYRIYIKMSDGKSFIRAFYKQ